MTPDRDPGPGAPPRFRTRSPIPILVTGISIGILIGSLTAPNRQTLEAVEVIGDPSEAASPDATANGTPATGSASTGESSVSTGPATITGTTGGAAAGSGTGGATDTDSTTGTDTTGASPDPTSGDATTGDGTTGAQPSGVEVRGVADDTIELGIGIPDLGVLAALGPNYDFGDPADHMEALLEDWRERGLVPVHGRDLKFFYERYDIVGTEQQRAACEAWAGEDVFAVVAVNQFWGQAECLTDEHGIPLLTTMQYYADTYTPKGAHLLFDLQTTNDNMLANFAHWMHDNGIVQGKTIGLYRPIGRDAIPITDTFVPTLQSLGYEIAIEITTDNHATGSPQDNVAAQRFAARGVDLAILFVSGINQTNFMQTAQSQRYKPTYVQSDYISSTNDAAMSTAPPEQLDGTLAMTQLRYGEIAAGMGMTPEGQQCVDNYAQRRGRRVDYLERPAEWLMLQAGCDEGRVLIDALQRAGRDLTLEGFLAALNQTTDLPMGMHTDITFRPGKRGGSNLIRTLQWQAACRCYVAISDFRPFYVSR